MGAISVLTATAGAEAGVDETGVDADEAAEVGGAAVEEEVGDARRWASESGEGAARVCMEGSDVAEEALILTLSFSVPWSASIFGFAGEWRRRVRRSWKRTHAELRSHRAPSSCCFLSASNATGESLRLSTAREDEIGADGRKNEKINQKK